MRLAAGTGEPASASFLGLGHKGKYVPCTDEVSFLNPGCVSCGALSAWDSSVNLAKGRGHGLTGCRRLNYFSIFCQSRVMGEIISM